MKNYIILFSSFIFIFACGNSSNSYDEYNHDTEYGSSYNYEEESDYPDDTYSATVEYYNPDTGFSNTYYLEVEVYDNHVTVIHFDNGGWLDEDQFEAVELDSDGCADITTYDYREFNVCLD